MSINWKNIEIYNAAELFELEDGVTWWRMPSDVCKTMEREIKDIKKVTMNTTGVELRFVIKGDEVRIKMASIDPPDAGVVCTFHVYYGAIQGGWEDHEVHKIIGNEPKEFIFKKNTNIEHHRRITKDFGYDFDPEVIRVIFDRGHIKLMDIDGDVEPPKKEETPKKVILNYGSSITHGSNSIDMSHSWTYLTAHQLNLDCRNLGMAGSCAMESAVIDYIADEGKNGAWDIATLELGINVLSWEEKKIEDRVTYAVRRIAEANPQKPIIVISPFYCSDDFLNNNKGNADKWRRNISEVISRLGYKNVYYKSGLEFIDNMSYISGDLVHPSIYGVQRIADILTKFIRENKLI